MINQQNMKVKNGSNWDSVCPFPIGYIYMSSNGTSPAATFGGTWSEIKDGRFFSPFNSWNSTGGTTSHNHWTNIGKGVGESYVYIMDDGSQTGQESWSGTGYGGVSLCQPDQRGQRVLYALLHDRYDRKPLAALPHLLLLVPHGIKAVHYG